MVPFCVVCYCQPLKMAAAFDLGDVLSLDQAQSNDNNVDDENTNWEALASIFGEEMDDDHMGLVEIAVSTSADQALKEMMEALDKENPPVAPSQTTGQNPKRLKKVTEQELLLLQENKQSVATKRNTSWSMKVFQGIKINPGLIIKEMKLKIFVSYIQMIV